MKRSCFVIGLASLFVVAGGVRSNAQGTSTLETTPDGVTYRVTQRSIPTTEYQAREQKSYRPQVTTEYQSYPQTHFTPVTQYQWVARQRGLWNPFIQPYWTHELAPVTHWEARSSTVQVPVARTDWVEETRVTHVPVTSYRTVQDRVAVSATPLSSGAIASSSSSTSVASRPIGGQQMQGDPPRDGGPWGSANGTTYRR
jgi:hypothetical protein